MFRGPLRSKAQFTRIRQRQVVQGSDLTVAETQVNQHDVVQNAMAGVEMAEKRVVLPKPPSRVPQNLQSVALSARQDT